MQEFLYFCTQNIIKLRHIGINIVFFCLFLCLSIVLLGGCNSQRRQSAAQWTDMSDSVATEAFDLGQIQANGELIMLTVSGPQTYYDYHGHEMGREYMLCQRFAERIGVRLRVEVCRDTMEMVRRLLGGDGDVVACPLRHGDLRLAGDSIKEVEFTKVGTDSTGHWLISHVNSQLSDALDEWFRPSMLDDVVKEEHSLLTTRRVTRHVYSPMLDRSAGVISRYDRLFMTYSRTIRWDWRLMAAQCYQESTFDPEARSWAGALGLMQIMPSTAQQLGLPMEKIHDPESNIAAAARYLGQLEAKFSDIPSRYERQNFALACYNGGYHHIRDAMALAARDGLNSKSWNVVSRYVLMLSQPRYYRDPIVKYGYMRGSETVDYVYRIRQRWQGYSGVKGASSGLPPSASAISESPVPSSSNQPHRAKHRKKKYILTPEE